MLIYFLLNADIPNEAEETRVYCALLETVTQNFSKDNFPMDVMFSIRQVKNGLRLNIAIHRDATARNKDDGATAITTQLLKTIEAINNHKNIQKHECTMYMFSMDNSEGGIITNCITKSDKYGDKIPIKICESLDAFLMIVFHPRPGLKLDPNFVMSVLDDVPFIDEEFGKENEEGDIEVAYFDDKVNNTINILIPSGCTNIDNDNTIFLRLIKVIPPALSCMLQKVELVLEESMVEYENILNSYIFPETSSIF